MTAANAAPGATKGHRWFAAFYARMTRREPPAMARQRRRSAGGASGRVLEIGAGTGANLPYYADATEVVATEPDPYMLTRARENVARSGRSVELHQAPAEALPFPDESFDTVVSTLVLCTVEHPRRALHEIRRVLKPGGTLRFYEHVRGRGVAGLAQDAVAPLWRQLFGGCNPNRRTAELLRAAGFEITELRVDRFAPGTPAIMGVAVNPGMPPPASL